MKAQEGEAPNTPEAKSTWEQILGALPTAKKLAKAEADLEAANGRAKDFEGKHTAAQTRITELEGQLAKKETDHAAEIVQLNADHKEAVDAKEADVEKRANLKAAEIAAGRGLKKPVKEEAGAGANESGESAFKTYARLQSEGKAAEAAQYYAANAEAIIKSRNDK